MNEDFLQYIWKSRSEKKAFTSEDGDRLTVLRAGEQNRDAGPDFTNAMIRMGDTTWVGSVEIHVKASDWLRHGHEKDPAYDNVVLHAVYIQDLPVYRQNGEKIMTIGLKELIPQKAYRAYLDFLNNHLWVPCANELVNVDKNMAGKHLERMCMDRISRRADQIRQMVSESKGDWNQAFFISLAGTMGTRINKDPFELLARKTPVQLILKNRSGMETLEAMFFGQAGFLENPFREDYPNRLAAEYRHLKSKYSLEGIPVHLWKFLRLRPVNFPTIRLAQLCAIYHRNPLPFGMLLEEVDPEKWASFFSVNVSGYWKTHFHFDRISVEADKRIGQEMTGLIIINTVIPFVYAFGQVHGKNELSHLALEVFKSQSPETNSIISRFNYFGLEFAHAMQTQGALELKRNWCDRQRCLDCGIGQELLKNVF